MKIKHWQGYGAVSAKKTSLVKKDGVAVLKVTVTGDHEYGIVCTDHYTLGNWLVKRFDKSFENRPRAIESVMTKTGIDTPSGAEKCEYEIRYRAD